MKIRQTLILVTGILSLSVLGISSLAVWTLFQISALKQTIEQGTQLIAESSKVRGLLHDLLFGMFAPETYTLLKDLTYAPRPYTTPREWTGSASRFQRDFESFMELPRVKNLLRDSELRDKYRTAMAMSDTAFRKIDSLNAKLRTLEAAGIIGSAGLYQSIQADNSPQLAGFFDDVRTTSYYLTNNFESFLDYFLLSLRAESELIQRQRVVTFLALSFLIGAIAIFITVALGRRISRSISNVESTIRKVSSGDFSAHLVITSDDEFGRLSSNLNRFIEDLKRNVDSILELHRSVGDTMTENLDLDAILRLVTDSAVRQTNADGAAIFLEDGEGQLASRAAAGSFLREEVAGSPSLEETLERVARTGLPVFVRNAGMQPSERSNEGLPVRSLAVLPLAVSRQTVGVLATVRCEPELLLTDLDFTNLSAFADYAALTIDNYRKYTELLERRQAEYLALQSQVQPHFLYNVLSGIIGLNRKGDRVALERTVLALKGMLRYTIEHEEWTTLREELEFVEQYCALQKIRFGRRLSVSIHCPAAALEFRIPKLILQPLVENAIIHGIEPLERPGSLVLDIQITGQSSSRVLNVNIEDDGVGFTPQPIDAARHVGLYSVRERLELAYRNATFQIESRPSGGTRVLLGIAGEELVP